MISLQDIVDLCPLTADEVAAIADHDHIGTATAAGLADYLMHLHHGPQTVQAMICDDIRAALHADDLTRARALFATLRQFMADHPDAARGAPA